MGDVARTARDTASDLARSARETAARQTGTVAAAIDAGKKAYQEEKRKTEMSGRIRKLLRSTTRNPTDEIGDCDCYCRLPIGKEFQGSLGTRMNIGN